LVRVACAGAYANRALDAALQRSDLPTRERALATELIYGTLRHGAALDERLGQFLQKPLTQLPPPVRVALQLGAYQILYTRVPAHSAVDESVALVRRFGRLRGLVNAVLRKVVQHSAQAASGDGGEPAAVCADGIAELAIRGSHPAWLVEQVVTQLGFDGAAAWVQANNVAAPLALRVRRGRATAAALTAQLSARGLQVQARADLPDCLELRRAGPVTALPGFAEGHFTVQDPAATLVGLWAAPQPGQRVLDVCAAPGGKAVHMAEQMQGQGVVVAVDVHPGRSQLVQQAAQRLGCANVHAAVADARDVAALQAALAQATAARGQSPGEAGLADLVVVDAPCSGMGTLRRNPELRRGDVARVAELAQLQAQILASAAQCVAVGGSLVYAVCTVTAEEGPEQIAAFCAAHPAFVPQPPPASLAAYADGMALRTWTHRHGMDSFFAAKLQRTA
jgi:16S rRNA (cytosine967-C5)-methyltransferase